MRGKTLWRLAIALTALIISLCGCAAHKPVVNPVPAWSRDPLPEYNELYPDKGIWVCPAGYGVWTREMNDLGQWVPAREAFYGELHDQNLTVLCEVQR
jgi:hypothetical protein